ncbi:MAG: lipid-A-disaccharide synthase N-terminal domain-containing protein [SAR324 cluster bacterium]|nr:lipid-A-disaccharide synthase N-terminal domain-containing protein [SAR324 cluster bacterium]
MLIGGFQFGGWEVFGLLGNMAFGSRFFLQWIASERAKQSIIPIYFWYLSLFGSFILLIYFIHLKSLIGILAYLPNVIPYTRNIILVKRTEKSKVIDNEVTTTPDSNGEPT